MDKTKTINEIIEQFPEQFRRAVKSGFNFSIEYTSNGGKCDQQYLDSHGYEVTMDSWGASRVSGLCDLKVEDSENFGTVYARKCPSGYSESFRVFCDMLDQGYVSLRRVGLTIGGDHYRYDVETGQWSKFMDGSMRWFPCDCPVD